MNPYYLGLDSSTQSISAILIDISCNQIVYQKAVDFSVDLNGYGVTDGFLAEQEKGVVHAPPLMWVEALDSLLLQMQTDGCPMEKIVAVAGSAQQHGSVYLNNEFNKTLSTLDPDIALHEQLTRIFSRKTSPIWMDTSTGHQCEAITATFDGADNVVQATGSVAVERFTGAQILKFAQQQPEAFQQTTQVMLVSSFMASLFAGHPVGIDCTDASGMNLLDIRHKTWHPTALAACGKDLQNK